MCGVGVCVPCKLCEGVSGRGMCAWGMQSVCM